MPSRIPSELYDQAYEEFLHGATTMAVCERYGISREAFRNYRVKNGLLVKQHGGAHFKSDDVYLAVKKDVDGGMRKYQACKKHGITTPSYVSWLKRNNLWYPTKKAYNAIDDEVYLSVLTDVRNGAKIRHACWDHNISSQAFLNWRKRNGVII